MFDVFLFMVDPSRSNESLHELAISIPRNQTTLAHAGVSDNENLDKVINCVDGRAVLPNLDQARQPHSATVLLCLEAFHIFK